MHILVSESHVGAPSGPLTQVVPPFGVAPPDDPPLGGWARPPAAEPMGTPPEPVGPLVPPDPAGMTMPVDPSAPAPNTGLPPIPPLLGAAALLPPINTNPPPTAPPDGDPFEGPAPLLPPEPLVDPEHAVAPTSDKQAAARRSRFVDRFECPELLHLDVAPKERFISSRLEGG